MKTLIILISIPLVKRNFKRFDINIFLNFFDKIKIYYIYEGFKFKKDKIFNHKKIKIFRINNYFELFKILKINEGTIFLDYTSLGFKSSLSKIILYFKNYKRIVSKIGILPSLKLKVVNADVKIKRFFKLIKITFFSRFDEIFFTKKNIYLCAGRIIQEQYRDKFTINCHSYDFYEKTKIKKNSIKKKDYFLYLDQYEHNHPDYKYAGYDLVNPKKFYDSLNNFFDKLEKKFKKEVVIAAHPKTKKHRYFGHRKVVRNKTFELSQKCYASIAHTSTAISFSIIYKKPIIFIYNNEMLRADSNKKKKICVLQNELGSSIYNIDKKNCINDLSKNLKKINNYKYDRYFKNYISYKVINKKKIGRIVCDIFCKQSNI